MEKPFGLSILVTFKDEHEEHAKLLRRLRSFTTGDVPLEIITLHDEDPSLAPNCHLLEGDFGAHKTYGNTLCKYSWILQLDADELPTDQLMTSLLHVIAYADSDPDIDAVAIPRVNRVIGLTRDHVKQWGWQIQPTNAIVGHSPLNSANPSVQQYVELYKELGINAFVGPEYTLFVDSVLVNYPDFQVRLYRNRPDIRWEGKVHEKLTTTKIAAMNHELSQGCYLLHDKWIDRQERQNAFYDTLQ